MDLADHIAQQHSVEEQARGKLLKEVDSKDAVPAPIPPPELFPELAGLEFDPNFPDDLVKDIDILLMTATDIELRGVLGYLNPLGGRKKIIKSFINSTWIYVGKYGGYSVVVGRSACAKSQQGGLNALLITNKIMKIYKPKYIIAIGVCFGMDQSKVQLGDVIVSDFIVDLSDFRKEPGSITARKPQPPAGTTLSSFFGNNSNLKIKCFQEENAKEVKVHCGPIASTSALVDDPKFKEELREARSDALAGEMEGAAIFSAARHAHHKPEAIVIKAVGDWGDGKKDECRGWKDFASHAAATYVHDSLKNAFLDSSSDSSSDASLYASPDIEEWLKEGRVDLTIKRVLMHGLPGSGKTCSQHLLLNEPPPKVDKSTPIACRAVKATRISVNDDRMERVDTKALLSSLAHDLKEAAAKQKKSPPEDHSTESKEKSSEAKTKSTDTTETEDPADDTEASKIRNDIVEAIPIAKAKLDTNWVYFVDSGGQTAFQELLPLFTRAASFNIITIDLSKGIDEKLEQKYRINGEPFSCDSEFSYSNIEFLKDVLSSGAILKPYHTPQPIIGSEEDITYPGYFVLGTHKDKATQENIKQYNEKLTSLTWGSEEKGYHIIPAIENSDTIIYPVNTMLESGPEREAEAKNLCKIIYNNTSGVKFNLSVQEFVLELTLLEKAEGRSFLSIEEVLPIGRSLQMTDNETMAALENLHNVTIILYYSEILPDRVFVDPHPILDILSRLLALTYKISQNFLCKHILISRETYSQNEFKDARKSLRERGVFTQSLLEKLKDDEKFPKKDFIDLLLRLHIIIEMDEKDKKDESKKREYFIPSALPSYPKTSRPPKSDIDPLQIIWRSPVTNPEDSCEILPIPRGIFPLSVINLKKSQQLQFRFPQITRQYLRYRDAMSFRLFFKGAHIGTIHIIKKQRRIEIYFAGDASKYCSLLCEAVKEAIASSCKAIHIKPDGYEFAFACPSTDGCYRIITDEVKKEVECTLCPTPPIISREEKFWSWFDKKSLTKVKYPMMIKEFRSLLNAIKEALAMKSIDDVKSCLLDLIKVADWASEVDAVTDETSLAQLHVLGRYCFLSNLSLLKCIIEKLDLKEAIKSRIDQLAEERDAFYSEVLVEDFAAAGIEDHKMIKEHHVEMTFVVSWNSSETTLTTFQDFITKEFKDLSMFIALRAVRHSRLTFVCTVPIWAIGAIKDAIKHAADSFKNGIQQLMLNDEDILCEETDLPSLNAGGDAGPLVDDQEVRKFKCTDINQYEMNTSPASGYCLVISMSGKEENREPGNGKDVKKLRSLFKDTLKFAFKEYKNFSQSQINKLLTNVQEDNHSFSSCFVMFILAHGTTDKDGDAVFETCDKVEEEGKIVEKYYPYKVSTIKKGLEITKGLYGRPKLLFIQSCRGQINNTGVLARDDPTDEESKKLIPFGSDFLMSFATIKEHAAYRHQDGSPFIRHLWYVFNTYHNTHDVLSMMTIVVMRMSVWSGTTDNGLLVKQIPEFTSTLRKFLYFRDASEEKKSKKSHSK